MNKVFIPFKGKNFKFLCHKNIACFNKCCYKLDLTLTPYDILRIKNCLKLSSDDFLEYYTDINLDEYPPFPIIKLKMQEDGKCPFVSKKGCKIYNDRPSACRLYPIARASINYKKTVEERFFIIQEEHCLGFNEDKEWSIDEWLIHQDIKTYDIFNIPWFEIITSYPEEIIKTKDLLFKKMQIFYLASYNLDKFRKFILNKNFFDLYNIPDSLRKKVKKSETNMLQFAINWLRFIFIDSKDIYQD